MNKLIGKKVFITDKNSWYYGDWGIVKDYDGNYYYIAIANDSNQEPVFDRSDFKIAKHQAW